MQCRLHPGHIPVQSMRQWNTKRGRNLRRWQPSFGRWVQLGLPDRDDGMRCKRPLSQVWSAGELYLLLWAGLGECIVLHLLKQRRRRQLIALKPSHDDGSGDHLSLRKLFEHRNNSGRLQRDLQAHGQLHGPKHLDGHLRATVQWTGLQLLWRSRHALRESDLPDHGDEVDVYREISK